MVERPKGITIWVLIEFITAIVLIVAAIICLSGFAFIFYNINLQAPLETLLLPFAGMRIDQLVNFLFAPGMFYIYGILLLLLGISFLANSILLFMMKESGRLLSVFNGVFILLTMVGIVLGIIMIWYFRRDKTRAYFQ